MVKRNSPEFQNLLNHFPKWIIAGNYLLFSVFIVLILLLSTLFNTVEEKQISAKVEQIEEYSERIEITLVSDCIFTQKNLQNIKFITIFTENSSSLKINPSSVKFLNNPHNLTVYIKNSSKTKNINTADSLILHTEIKSNRLYSYIKKHFNLFKTF